MPVIEPEILTQRDIFFYFIHFDLRVSKCYSFTVRSEPLVSTVTPIDWRRRWFSSRLTGRALTLYRRSMPRGEQTVCTTVVSRELNLTQRIYSYFSFLCVNCNQSKWCISFISSLFSRLIMILYNSKCWTIFQSIF